VVLLDFWGTFCEVCKVEIPWYVEFQSKYKESGLSVVGVSLDEDGWKSVKPFVEEKKVNYPIVIGNWDLARLFGFGNELPLTLLIDRDGKIADLHAGIVNKNTFESEIQILLKESASKGMGSQLRDQSVLELGSTAISPYGFYHPTSYQPRDKPCFQITALGTCWRLHGRCRPLPALQGSGHGGTSVAA
jgi:thiol-disulfide isomerase/thioredoxin